MVAEDELLENNYLLNLILIHIGLVLRVHLRLKNQSYWADRCRNRRIPVGIQATRNFSAAMRHSDLLQ
jgi:phage gp46-like protein